MSNTYTWLIKGKNTVEGGTPYIEFYFTAIYIAEHRGYTNVVCNILEKNTYSSRESKQPVEQTYLWKL